MTNISPYTHSSHLNQFLMPYAAELTNSENLYGHRKFPESTVVVSIGDPSSRLRDCVQLWTGSHRAVSVCNSEDQRGSFNSMDSLAFEIYEAIRREYQTTPGSIKISCADKNIQADLITKLEELYVPEAHKSAAK